MCAYVYLRKILRWPFKFSSTCTCFLPSYTDDKETCRSRGIKKHLMELMVFIKLLQIYINLNYIKNEMNNDVYGRIFHYLCHGQKKKD